jgi:hypothetical protein
LAQAELEKPEKSLTATIVSPSRGRKNANALHPTERRQHPAAGTQKGRYSAQFSSPAVRKGFQRDGGRNDS